MQALLELLLLVAESSVHQGLVQVQEERLFLARHAGQLELHAADALLDGCVELRREAAEQNHRLEHTVQVLHQHFRLLLLVKYQMRVRQRHRLRLLGRTRGNCRGTVRNVGGAILHLN